MQYTTSTETLTDLGTVNLSAIAAIQPSAAAKSSGSGKAGGQPLGRLRPTGSRGKPISAGSFSVVTGNVADETGFPGVTEAQEAAVNVPNSITPTFSDATPPDQGTCAGSDASGNPIAIEIVNNAVAAYSESGTSELAVSGSRHHEASRRCVRIDPVVSSHSLRAELATATPGSRCSGAGDCRDHRPQSEGQCLPLQGRRASYRRRYQSQHKMDIVG